MFGTVAHNNLRSIVGKPVLAVELCSYGFAQAHIASYRRIESEVLVYGLFGSLFDVFGRVEVGLADAHVHHIHACGFKLGALLRHGKRLRHCQGVHSVGYSLHNMRYFAG